MMKYTIESRNVFKTKYYNTPNESKIIQEDTSRYIDCTAETAKAVIKDILDPPEADLTMEHVEKEFSSPSYPISKEKLEAIVHYYNGRAKIYAEVMKYFEHIGGLAGNSKTYKIPYEFNQFGVNDSELVEQIEAYIKITATL